jgi:hypothetical protein
MLSDVGLMVMCQLKTANMIIKPVFVSVTEVSSLITETRLFIVFRHGTRDFNRIVREVSICSSLRSTSGIACSCKSIGSSGETSVRSSLATKHPWDPRVPNKWSCTTGYHRCGVVRRALELCEGFATN